MQKRRRIQRLAATAICGASVAASTPALAGTATVTVSQTPVGKTLQYVGYNQGHYLAGSNTSAWVDYSGVNGFRVWATSSDYEVSHGTGTMRDDLDPWGDGVTSLSTFNSRKTALRADPLNQQYIDWNEFNTRFGLQQSGRNAVVWNHILGEMKARDIHVLNVTTRSAGAFPITDINTDWAGKWEQWQHYYAMAFHAARNYDVAQWQMYNEPNGDPNISSNMPEYVMRLQLASDAIRSAIADVNTRYGKSLVPDIAAPVSAGGAARVDDWGKAALQAIRTDFSGAATNYDIFNTYAAQVYDKNGASFGAEAASIKSKIQTPGYHAGGPAAAAAMPLIFSEFNRHTSNNYANMPTVNLETSTVVTDIASIYLNAMAAGTESMYAFKFSQTIWLPTQDPGEPLPVPEPQKTGFHYVSDAGLKDITGATHASGVVRLVAKGFQDRRNLLGTTLSNLSGTTNGIEGASSYDPATGNYYLLQNNRNTISHTLTFDLSSWDVATGTVVSIEEVRSVAGGSHNGDVVQMVALGADKRITLNQSSNSAWLLTVPGGARQSSVNLVPTADAGVRNAAPASNFGSATTAGVGRSPGDTTFDYATYVKFNIGETDASDVSRAILRLNGQAVTDGSSANPGSILLHVYALANDTWTEGAINWNNAPNLNDPDIKTTGVGVDAFPVGQLTFTGGSPQLLGIDLTKFLSDHPELVDDGQLTFALVREERFAASAINAADADPTSSYVNLFTKEAGSSLAPALSLFLTPQSGVRTVYWDTNGALNAGAGGTAPAGAWNGTTVNFNLDSTGGAIGGMLQTPTTTADTVVFTAGSDGTGNYTVTLTGTQTAAAVNIARGNVTLAGGTLSTGSFDVASGATGTVSSVVTGGSGSSVTKTGAGTLTLSGSAPYTGATTVTAGRLRFANNASLTGVSSTSSLTVNGGTAELANTASDTVVDIPVTIAGATDAWVGTVDLQDNDLIARYTAGNGVTKLAQVTNQIKNGLNINGTLWGGTGLTSTEAGLPANQFLTALGVISNDLAINGLGGSGPFLTSFAGRTVDANAVLVKYTYFGDANLDGVVDDTDYSLIDTGFGNNATDWVNGDFSGIL